MPVGSRVGRSVRIGLEVNSVHSPEHTPVWMYWEDAADRAKPAYLELCLDTIKRHLDPTMRLQVLDFSTIFNWLPDLSTSVWWSLGTPVRRSDYARVRLIERYGGLWVDADCVAMSSLRPLVAPLSEHEVVGWGGDVGGRFYNNLFAARPGAPFLREWIASQDQVLEAHDDWASLSWAALGQEIMYDLLPRSTYHSIPFRRIAPVLWYEWRRLLSPLQSPARVLESDPITVTLYNSVMERYIGNMSAESLLHSQMLIGRLFRIALGISGLPEELDLATRLSFVSDLRFSTGGRRLEHRLRAAWQGGSLGASQLGGFSHRREDIGELLRRHRPRR